MLTFVLIAMVVLYVIACLFLIVVILGQEGKGGGLSGLIGASSLGDTLGASAAESTLRRWTRNCAILFIVLSLGLTIVGSRVFTRSILDDATGIAPTEEAVPPPETTEATTSPTTLPPEAGEPIVEPITEPAVAPSTPAGTIPSGGPGSLAPAPPRPSTGSPAPTPGSTESPTTTP